MRDAIRGLGLRRPRASALATTALVACALGWCHEHAELAHAATSCVIETTTGLRFGGYTSTSRLPLDSTAFVTYSCQGVTAADVVVIQLSRSQNGSFMPRALRGTRDELEYNVYLDAARSLVWGDGTAATGEYRGRPQGSGRVTTVPIYGRIKPRQDVRPGSYQDTLVLTLLF
jgi:spore coat protein U-like protein